jgi:hypothetical protein
MTPERLEAIIKGWLRANDVSIIAHGQIPKSWEFERDLAAHILEQAREDLPLFETPNV